MKRLLTIAVLATAVVAHAKPEFLEVLKKTYPLKGETAIAAAECNICHSGPPKRNPYGKDVEAAIKRGTLTAAILHSLDARDSDGDGATNEEEIRAGTLPGDPESKPAGTKTPPLGAEASAASSDSDLVPKHSGHPLIIHFPIALFLFGAFLDRLGKRSGDDGVRRGAVLTMTGGAMTSLFAVATGWTAALRLGYVISPGQPVFTHLVLGVLATLSMLASVAQRRRDADGPVTIAAIVIAAVFVIAAGHFGGSLVYDR